MRNRIFYGWWIVAASSFGLSTNPGQFAFGAIGIFIIPLGAEFGWDRAGVSLALTLFTAALAVSFPLVGRLVDRYGSRQVLLPSMLVFGLLLGLVPIAVSELWHLWLLFLLIGSLGAGSNSLPYLRILGAWFDRRRGLAFGIAMAGGGLGYAYVPPMLQYLIDHYGWRHGYYALSGIVLLVALPLVAAVLRNDPADMGLAADGEGESERATATDGEPIRVASLLRRPLFYLLFAIFAVLSACLYGLLAHLVPMLVDRGMPASRAVIAATLLGAMIVAARAGIGYLIDRYFAPFVAAVCVLLSAGGVGLLAGGAVDYAAYAAALLVGLSIGAEIDLLAFLTTRYFGLRSFGTAYGLLFVAFLAGTATGPLAYGHVFDLAGSYDTALAAGSALLFVTAFALLVLPRYGRGADQRPASSSANATT